ncbi:hypothetical protein ACOMHN_008435 [Nucella lapillus]
MALSKRLHVFPVIMALYLPVTFFITYGMAVHYEHVEPIFPYISDTGTIPPESCLFGQLLNIYAILTAWCMYVRYKQVRLYYCYAEDQGLEAGSARYRSVRRKQIINKACLVIGVITALGVSIVGNFQEDNVLVVHLIGAMMAFGGSGLYSWIQSLISYKMAKLPNSRACCRHTRVVLCAIHSICFLILLIATKLSVDKFPLPMKEIKNWKPSQPGYTEHLFATFAEWVMGFISSAYFLTFVGEFKVVQTKMLILPVTATTCKENRNNSTTITNAEAESETKGEKDPADSVGGDCCCQDGGGDGGEGDGSCRDVREGGSNIVGPCSCELMVGKVSE